MKKKIQKGAALILALIIGISCTSFTKLDGFGYLYLDTKLAVYEGTDFHVEYGSNPSIGSERAYFVESDLSASDLNAIVMNGAVRSTSTLSSMVKYAEENLGVKVAAAINGDIFDTSSGCPKNPVIHEHILITSGYEPDRVVAFGDDGKAALVGAGINFKLKGTIGFNYYPEVAEGTEGGGENQDTAAEGESIQSEDTESESGEDAGETAAEPVYVEKDWEGYPGFFNVPQGNYNGITMYNAHYAQTTYTRGSRVEAVLAFNETPQLKLGESIEGRVAEIRLDCKNTAIGQNELILSANSGTEAGNFLAALVPDSIVEVSVDAAGGSGLEKAKEAVGIYYSLVEGGKVVTNGTAVNPRTALGIKKDGSIVLYVIDGRQASVSQGLSLPDLARHMIALGCTEAFNLDGGGSSAIYARAAGIDETAVRKNSPSGGSERKVANAVLLVYPKGGGGSGAKQLNVTADKYFAMPGARIGLSAYASNEKYEKTSMPHGLTYFVEKGEGSIEGQSFVAGRSGEVLISAEAGEAVGETKLYVTDDFTLSLSRKSISLKGGESIDIDAVGSVGPLSVAVDDSLFTWECMGDIGEVDENGVFTAAGNAIGGLTGSLIASYGELRTSIPVTVGAALVEFEDTKEHWAREPIGELAALGIINGMGEGLFLPDEGLTRAQFLTMLAKTQGIETSAWSTSAFSDVSDEDWYLPYVAWGYQNGIVSGVSETRFAPDDPITREQICVMLGRFIERLGNSLVKTREWTGFEDGWKIDDWALPYVGDMVTAGIMNGMPDGNFDPLSGATRAQAAQVVYRLESMGLTVGELEPDNEYAGTEDDEESAGSEDLEDLDDSDEEMSENEDGGEKYDEEDKDA